LKNILNQFFSSGENGTFRNCKMSAGGERSIVYLGLPFRLRHVRRKPAANVEFSQLCNYQSCRYK